MKRSSITLISIGIAGFLLIAAIPVMYQVELSKAQRARVGYSKLAFNDAKVVKIQGMQQVTIVPFDSLIVGFEEKNRGDIQVQQTGDTLVVTGRAPVMILSGKREIMVVESDVLVKGDLKRLDAFSMSVHLRNSHLFSLPISKDSKESQHLEDFRITADDASVVDLNGRFEIGHLYVTNVKEFNCSSQVGLRATDFYFSNNAKVQTMTCREGMNIVAQ